MPTTTTNLSYRKFDELMSSVERDLYTFADEGYFSRSMFIKEVRKVNANLGLRICKEREDVLDVFDHTALLPPDFQFLQLALACHVGHFSAPELSGAKTESHVIDINLANRSCSLNGLPTGEFKGACDNTMWVTQRLGIKTYTFSDVRELQLTQSSSSKCADFCMNHHFKHARDQMRIEEDHATFSFREGKVFINYLADMVDDDNNILILDHPMVNDYYEYTIKEKFFENMFLNKEGDFVNSYKAMQDKLRMAKIHAISFINTPEYGQLIKMFTDNRHRFYKKYIGYFNDTNSGFYKGEPHSRHDRTYNNKPFI